MAKWRLVVGAMLAAVSFGPAHAFAARSEGTFESNGLVLHYEIGGQGSPVVILAGGPGFGASYMQPVFEIVAKNHTAILLDQRGTGRSVPAAETPQIVNEALVVSDLERLRRKLGYARWTLLGHSFGTFTAMKYAIAYPDHVQSLALLAVMAPIPLFGARLRLLTNKVDDYFNYATSPEFLRCSTSCGRSLKADRQLLLDLRQDPTFSNRPNASNMAGQHPHERSSAFDDQVWSRERRLCCGLNPASLP